MRAAGAKHDAAASDQDEFDDDDAADGEMAMPKRATAWETRTFVMTKRQPSAEKLARCMEQVASIAAEAGNQDDLQTAPEELKALVASDAGLYHTCFFHLMVRLDDRLAVGGPVMTDLATLFFEQMKSLWILARALDQTTGVKHYFQYLQQRYIQLSRDYFGRDIQVVAPPLGERRVPRPSR